LDPGQNNHLRQSFLWVGCTRPAALRASQSEEPGDRPAGRASLTARNTALVSGLIQKIRLAKAGQYKILSHRRRLVLMPAMGPGPLRREDAEGASHSIIRMHPSTRDMPDCRIRSKRNRTRHRLSAM